MLAFASRNSPSCGLAVHQCRRRVPNTEKFVQVRHYNRDHKNQTGATREKKAPNTTARTGGAGKPAAAYSRVNRVCAF